MATIQMVNRLSERQGLNLATALAREEDVSAVCWWADEGDPAPRLLVGFDSYLDAGPLACIERLDTVLRALPLGEAPGLMDTESVASDDPRLAALVWHSWTNVPITDSDLTYRIVDVWTRSTGSSQALVYFLKAGDETRVPLPVSLTQAA